MSHCSKTTQALAFTFTALFGVTVFLSSVSLVCAQTPPPTGVPDSGSSNSNKSDRPDLGNAENEMRARLALKAAKKEYDENLARAREVSEIASQLLQNYEGKKSLSSDDWKKVERLEKLTKRIRNEAGGSEAEPDNHDLPAVLEDAVKRVAGLAGDLKKAVEQTPRHVISAAVIDQANKMIGLLQHVRNLR